VFYQSGFPLTPVTGFFFSNSDSGSLGPVDRPNRIRDGNLPKSQRTPERWFDTGAFVFNNFGEFGNSGRGVVTSDGMRSWDLALHKDFFFGDRQKLQLRLEMYNALNHVNFEFPILFVVDARFGRITSAGTSRQTQIGLKCSF
jgi:hypothetical protein